LNKSLVYLLTCILLLTSWAKAGLAGDWILFAVDATVTLSFIFLLVQNKTLSHSLVSFVPIALLIIQFLISYHNPTYKVLENKDWAKLEIENSLAQETNIEKIVMVSESFKNIMVLSKTNPSLSHTVFFDFKNRYFDKFPNSITSSAKLIIKYENLITLSPHLFLPTLAINDKSTYLHFIHKICQLSMGLLFFYLCNKRIIIRRILLMFSINTGLLAIVGIWQKINYIPSDTILEILGIWDAPEPRYYFSTFTYKNHWCAFALFSVYITFALLNHNWRKYGTECLRNIQTLLLFLSLCFTIVSIPLSGSRSGSLFLVLSIFIVILFVLRSRKIKRLKIWFLYTTSSTVIICLLFLFVSKLHQASQTEMITNLKTQVNGLKYGKSPLRILLWKDLCNQISQKPIFGFGFNSYSAVNPIYQSSEVRAMRSIVLSNAHHRFTPLIKYGHNDWLEKISEFGLVGFLISLPYLLKLFFIFTKSPSIISKILIISAVVFLAYSIVDFPSQTPVCLLIFSTVIGLAAKYSYLSQKKFKLH